MTNSTSIRYSPCFNCSKKLNKAETIMHKRIKVNRQLSKKLQNSSEFSIGPHGAEKAMLKNIDFTSLDEISLAVNGEVIEMQKGRNHGEFKIILFNKRDKEPIHYIFLVTSGETLPTLINVYNPTEGMNFKWSRDGKRRLYLNTFRSCCPHPLDHKENFNKKHHGVQHSLYNYQH